MFMRASAGELGLGLGQRIMGFRGDFLWVVQIDLRSVFPFSLDACLRNDNIQIDDLKRFCVGLVLGLSHECAKCNCAFPCISSSNLHTKTMTLNCDVRHFDARLGRT